MLELLTIGVAASMSTLLLGVGYVVGRQSTWSNPRVDPQPPTSDARPPQPDAPWRAPRYGGYRGKGGAIPTSPPPGTSATSRGRTPPPPRGGSGQATAR